MRNIAVDRLPEWFELPCSKCKTNTRRDLLQDMSDVSPMLNDCCPVCVEKIEDTLQEESLYDIRNEVG